MKYTKIYLLLACITSLSLFAKTKTKGLPKIDPTKEIVFGQTAFLSEGPLKLYSDLIKNAILARFNRINNAGGIQKKTLQLISLDDHGEPKQAAQNIDALQKHGVSMFIGNTGTRSVLEVLPKIEAKKITMLFPWGGDERLRRSNLSHIVHGVGFMMPQIEKIAYHIARVLRLEKVALFHADSTFGIENKNMMIDALKKYNITPVAIGSYNRFTMNIEGATKALIEADPKVLVCLSTSMPAVKIINALLEKGLYGTKFIGIDSTMFVGTILKKRGIPFSYTSPMPDPTNKEIPIVKEFLEDMKKSFPDDPINILSLAYYTHAAIVADALKKIEGEITPEKLLKQIEQMKQYDLGGFIIDFNGQTRHAYPHVISILQ